MEFLKFVVNQHIPVRDMVFITLRENILLGNIRPGERLMEKNIAEKMGVSRTPVRESLRRLELEQLVTIEPRRGAYVSHLSKEEIHDLLELHCSLECLGATLACKFISEELLCSVKSAANNFAAACGEDCLKDIADTDQALHDLIFHASKNRKLVYIVDHIKDQVYRYRLEYLRAKDVRKTIIIEHDRLINALERRDEKRAHKIARSHIENQERFILASI